MYPFASTYHFTVLAEVAVRVMSPSPQMLVLDTVGAAGSGLTTTLNVTGELSHWVALL